MLGDLYRNSHWIPGAVSDARMYSRAILHLVETHYGKELS